MSVPVQTEPAFTFGNAELVVERGSFRPVGRNYDVSPERVLVIEDSGTSDAELVYVLNCAEELMRLVP